MVRCKPSQVNLNSHDKKDKLQSPEETSNKDGYYFFYFISILFYSFPHNNIPTMTLKHKVSRKIYQRKFSRYMHTVVSMKQIPSIYSKPELKGRDYPLFPYLVTTKSAFPVSRNRISMIVNNHLVLPIIFLKIRTGGRDEYNLSSSTCT